MADAPPPGLIPDDAGLLRRIHPKQVVEDKNTGQPRPSSAAFKDPALSVDVEPILVSQGHDWQFTLRGYSGWSLVRLVAGAARDLGLTVDLKPLPDNPAHAEVTGRKTGSIADALKKASTWVHLEN
jgi:hypothetical protein